MFNEYYHLKEEPFRLTPDPRFLHMAEPHRAALNALLYGVAMRKGLAVVTGPVGCGKTTLLHTLLELLAQGRVSKAEFASAIIVNPTLSRDEFFELLLDEFEITCPSPSKSQRLLALEKIFRNIDRRGGTCVLFIDEAHLLSIELLEEIRLLSNIDTHSGKLLQVILSGQVELFQILDKPETRALKQRIATRCQIRALSFPETQLYIADRLRAAGLTGPDPFSSQALEVVYRYGQGVPRLINLICDGCLCIGFQAQRNIIEPDIVHEAANALDLTEVKVEEPAVIRHLLPTGATEPSQVLGSTVDVLIQAMKKGLNEARAHGQFAMRE